MELPLQWLENKPKSKRCTQDNSKELMYLTTSSHVDISFDCCFTVICEMSCITTKSHIVHVLYFGNLFAFLRPVFLYHVALLMVDNFVGSFWMFSRCSGSQVSAGSVSGDVARPRRHGIVTDSALC